MFKTSKYHEVKPLTVCTSISWCF